MKVKVYYTIIQFDMLSKYDEYEQCVNLVVFLFLIIRFNGIDCIDLINGMYEFDILCVISEDDK
jgi:hypothetical protein